MARRATNEPVQRVRSVTWDINQLMIVAKLKAWILATPWSSAPAATGTTMTGTPPIPTTASWQYFANCLPIAASFSWKQKSPKWRLSLLSSIRASNPKKVYLCWTFSEYACVFKSVSDHNPWSFSLYELSAVIFDRENSLSQNGYGLSQGRYWGLISVDWSTSVFKMTQWITNFHQFVPPCFSCLNGTIRSSEQNYFYSPNSCKKHLQVQRVGDN